MSPGDSTEQSFGAREQLAIWLLLIASFVVILNETVMGVALPNLMENLQVTAVLGQWLTTAFFLTMSIVIPITGMLIQRFRTRTLFIAAMSLFSLGTLASALAPGFGLLVVGRVVQASGTAIMLPLLMTTVVTLVPADRRGRLMGRIAIVISVAPAIGPTISGLILQVFSWRWLFLFVLPVALVALLLGALRLPNVGETRPRRVDWLSFGLSAIGFGGLVYGLSAIGDEASGEALVAPAIPLSIGVIALGLFVWRQLALQDAERALLDLRTFRSRAFSVSIIIFACSGIALFGSLIVLPIYVQTVLGYETLATGLVLLPGGLLMGLLGPVVGRIVDARGAKFILIPGVFVMTIAMVSMVFLAAESPIWQVLLSHLLLSIGLACVFTPLFSASLGSLPPSLASHGSAMVSTIQQVAGAAGTALFVTIMTLVSTALAGSPTGISAADLAAGVRVAFVAGAAISALAVVLAFAMPSAKALVRED